MTKPNDLDLRLLKGWKTIPQLVEDTGWSYDSVKGCILRLMKERRVELTKLPPDGKTSGPRPTAYRLMAG